VIITRARARGFRARESADDGGPQRFESARLSQRLQLPAIGVRTAARILLQVGDASHFASATHLAAYAGIAPVNRSSGSSIKRGHPARTGNRKLKRAFFLAAFAALMCLARRRCDVLYAMPRNKTHYRHPEPKTCPQRLDKNIGTSPCAASRPGHSPSDSYRTRVEQLLSVADQLGLIRQPNPEPLPPVTLGDIDLIAGLLPPLPMGIGPRPTTGRWRVPHTRCQIGS
jgi:hypothetical protein